MLIILFKIVVYGTLYVYIIAVILNNQYLYKRHLPIVINLNKKVKFLIKIA